MVMVTGMAFAIKLMSMILMAEGIEGMMMLLM